MKKFFPLLAFICICNFNVHAQKNDCLTDFDFIVNKIKADYPGYNDKVNSATKDKLFTLEKNLREKLTAYPDSCYSCLKQYASFFKDNHLRVRRVWNDNEWKNRKILDVSSFGKNVTINTDSLFNVTAKANSIEGIWSGSHDEFAVVKNRKGDGFIGVAIKSGDWQKNQVMYEFKPIGDSEFQVIEHSLTEGAKPTIGKASLHLSNRVLEIHDETRFVRKTNSEAFDKALRSAYTPQYPNGRNTYPVATYLSDSTYYFRFSSFYTEEVSKQVKKHWNEIVSRPNLIIDIRNNGGGLDQYYQILLKLIYTKPYESKGVEWYASEGNIKSFEDAINNGHILGGEEGLRWTKVLVEEMKKNKGGFAVHPMMGSDNIIKLDTILRYPKRVGVIINEGNASSAEQFLLAAKESDKVILFGNQNTAGVLDYSNMESTLLPSSKYELLYPMTRSRRLPDHPIDNIGIAPNVIIPFPATEQLYDRLDCWVYFVKDYLEFNK